MHPYDRVAVAAAVNKHVNRTGIPALTKRDDSRDPGITISRAARFIYQRINSPGSWQLTEPPLSRPSSTQGHDITTGNIIIIQTPGPGRHTRQRPVLPGCEKWLPLGSGSRMYLPVTDIGLLEFQVHVKFKLPSKDKKISSFEEHQDYSGAFCAIISPAVSRDQNCIFTPHPTSIFSVSYFMMYGRRGTCHLLRALLS